MIFKFLTHIKLLTWQYVVYRNIHPTVLLLLLFVVVVVLFFQNCHRIRKMLDGSDIWTCTKYLSLRCQLQTRSNKYTKFSHCISFENVFSWNRNCRNPNEAGWLVRRPEDHHYKYAILPAQYILLSYRLLGDCALKNGVTSSVEIIIAYMYRGDCRNDWT